MTDQPDDQSAESNDDDRTGRARVDRRRFLIGAGAAVAGVAAVLAFGLRGGRGKSVPLGPLSTVLSDFPVRSAESAPPASALDRWTIEVGGLVARPLKLTVADLATLPRVGMTRDFHCVEGWSVDRVRWAGVRLAEVLDRAQPQAAAGFVTFHTFGGLYVDSLTMAEGRDPSVLLADSLDGAPLPREHGGPVRLVVPAQLGYKNVKWVTRVELTDHRDVGYWEQHGYPVEAPIGGA